MARPNLRERVRNLWGNSRPSVGDKVRVWIPADKRGLVAVVVAVGSMVASSRVKPAPARKFRVKRGSESWCSGLDEIMPYNKKEKDVHEQ